MATTQAIESNVAAIVELLFVKRRLVLHGAGRAVQPICGWFTSFHRLSLRASSCLPAANASAYLD